MADLPAPKRGGKPKRITTDAPPGGRYTPGARRGRPMPNPKERRITGVMDVQGGLSQMLGQAGGDKGVVAAAQQVESMPGGMELL